MIDYEVPVQVEVLARAYTALVAAMEECDGDEPDARIAAAKALRNAIDADVLGRTLADAVEYADLVLGAL